MWQLLLSLVWGLLCLYDLLKYFVIFPVASNNSAMWSGLMVEMESGFVVVIDFVLVTVMGVMKGVGI